MKFPLEIFENILSTLSLIDILNLSETSKSLNYICRSSKLNVLVKVDYDNYRYVKNIWPRLKHFVDIPFTGITDINGLSNVHKLNLSNSWNLFDVSSLKNLHTLDIRRCKNVSDVSSLRNLHTLDMSLCTNVLDVSNLKSLHTLDISYCCNIYDVSELCNLYELNISYTSVYNIDNLKNVKILNVSGCCNLLEIGVELNCHTIDLSYTKIICVDNLKRVKNICLNHSKVEDVSKLTNVYKLIMLGCPNVRNLEKLIGRVQYLDWKP